MQYTVLELCKYFRNHHEAKGVLKEFPAPGKNRWNRVLHSLESFIPIRDFAEIHKDRIENNIVKIIHNLTLMKQLRNLILELTLTATALDKLQSKAPTISD